MFYNKDIMPTPFATLEAFAEASKKLKIYKQVPLQLTFTQPFYVWPFLAAGGGYLFGGKFNEPDVSDIGLTSKSITNNLEQLSQLMSDGVIENQYSKEKMVKEFNKGKVAAMIEGFWSLDEIDKNLNFSFAPLPTINGQVPRPFVTVKSIHIVKTKRKGRRKLIEKYIGNYLLADTSLEKLIRPPIYSIPVYSSALKKIPADSPLHVIMQNVDNGIPIPIAEEIKSFWHHFPIMLSAVLRGRVSPQKGLEAVKQKMEIDIGQ